MVEATEMAKVVKGLRGTLSQSVLRHLRASGDPSLRLAHQQVFESIDAEGTRVTVLAERAGISHQAMGELVAELVELRYLERVADPDDRRSRLVRPTVQGRQSIERGREYLVTVRADWERALGDDLEVDKVLDALRALRRVLDEDLTDA
jgi:DNA-binding MarR family transcriptional regulator